MDRGKIGEKKGQIEREALTHVEKGRGRERGRGEGGRRRRGEPIESRRWKRVRGKRRGRAPGKRNDDTDRGG